MNLEEYRLYGLSKKGSTESTPYSKLPIVLVFKAYGKIFTDKVIDTFESFSSNCYPETIREWRSI